VVTDTNVSEDRAASIFRVEEARSSKTLVSNHHIIRRNNSENHKLHRVLNLTFHEEVLGK